MTVAGSIHTDRKPRRKSSLKDKVAALDKRIAKMEQRLNILKQKRASLVAEAKAALAEIDG